MSSLATFCGIGVHRGVPATVHLSKQNQSGVTLITPNGPINVVSARTLEWPYRTAVGHQALFCDTVEHLLAALSRFNTGFSVAINGPEVPIMDGSAAPFFNQLCARGLSESPIPITINHPIEFEWGHSHYKLWPCKDGHSPRYRVKLTGLPPFLQSHGAICFQPFSESFSAIANARTFAHMNQATAMRKMGLALGGGPQNALLFNDHQVVSPEGLRMETEPARHKMLDLIGDLFLLGGTPYAHLEATNPGHRANRQLVDAIRRRQAA